ncbi:DedA family protein [Streptomyces asiaticus]|uniref:DedA family protein n=1 Tax=Streptomyces asiaticus TaxID=114695 RepID=UPI0039BE7278
MNILANTLGQVPAASAYAIVAVAVLAESVLLVGAFIPTLTLLLTAGALARTGRLDLPSLVTTAACAVVAGDFLAHRTGKVLGDRLRTGRLGRRLPAAAWRRAEALMARRGGHAVFLARFLPILRTLIPHLVGAARLPYRRIAPYSALAASLWATAEAGTGYTAAASLQRALTLGGPVLAATAAATAGAVLAWTRIHGRTRTQPLSDGPRSKGRDTQGPWWLRKQTPRAMEMCPGHHQMVQATSG